MDNKENFAENTKLCAAILTGPQSTAIAGAQRLFSEFGIENLLVTLSEHGMIFIPSSNPSDFVCIPTERIKNIRLWKNQ